MGTFVKQPDCGTHALSQKLGIMLFLLAVLTAASAEPQIPLSPYYNPYLQYYPQYQVQRQVPLSYYPGRVGYPSYPMSYPSYDRRIPGAQARFSFGGFMQKGAAFTTQDEVMGANAKSEKTLRGDITFYQNPFTWNNAKFHVNLPNITPNTRIGIYIHNANDNDCNDDSTDDNNPTQLTSLTTPFIQINGAYVDGSTNMFNLNGADGKTDISGRYISIRDLGMNCPACVIGCTGSGLS